MLIQDPWWGPIGHAKSVSDSDSPIYGTTASRAGHCLLPPDIGPTCPPGVSIYYRKGISGLTATLATDVILSRDNLAVDFQLHGNKIRIHNVYLHGERFNRTFANIIEHPHDMDIPSVIAGDFNLHHRLWQLEDSPSPSQLAEAADLAEWIISNDLDIINHLNVPTRRGKRNQRDSIIDLTIINTQARELGLITDWECSPDHAMGSDHNCITWSIQRLCSPHYSPPAPTFRYCIDAEQRDDWVAELALQIERHPLPEYYQHTQDLEHGARTILQAMQDATRKIMKRVEVNTKAPRAKWWNEACDMAVGNINRCTNGGAALEQARGQLRSAIRRAKRDHFNELLQEVTIDNLFEKTNWYKGKRNSKVPPLRVNGEVLVDPQAQARAFKGAFFPSNPPEVDTTDPLGIPLQPRRNHHPITRHEVQTALDKSSNTSALGAFGTNYRLLKWAFQILPDQIVQLYNGCLELGYHPNCLRNAVVQVIPKPNKSDMSNPRSYRPISLLETLSKCLEKVVTTRLLHEVGKFNLIPFTQFGGRDNSSCVDAGLTLAHDVQSAWSHGQQVSLLTMDISGYFNNVNHERLIFTLRRLGFADTICSWLGSYLQNRSIQIRIDGLLCNPVSLQPVGIPQGSPLSPVLSSLYSLPILYLFRHEPEISIRAYVDDFTIMVTGRSFNSNRDELEEAAHTANSTLRKLGLEFELKKSELIHFARSNGDLAHNPNIVLEKPNGGAHTVRATNSIRWLGFFLDRRLNFKDHVRKMAIKGLSVIAGLKMLANTVRGLSVYHARILFKTCVVPILTYGSPIWFRSKNCKSLISPIAKTQNVGLRWLLGAFRTSPVPAMEHAASIAPMHITLQKLNERASARFRRLPIKSEVARRLPVAWDSHDQGAPQPDNSCASQTTSIYAIASLSHPDIEHVDPYLASPWESPDDLGRRLKIICPTSEDSRSERDQAVETAIGMIAAESASSRMMVFTDGSARIVAGCRKVGCGFSIIHNGQELETGRIGIGPRAEVFDAEMFALAQATRRAVSLALSSDTRGISIHSDNQSAVQQITRLTAHPNQFCSIIARKEIDDFLAAHPDNNITFRWVKAHHGIEGNERADVLAKEAGDLPPTPLFNRTITWARASASRKAAKRWRSYWASAHKSTHVQTSIRHPPSLSGGGIGAFHLGSELRRSTHSRLIQVILGHCSVGEYFKRFIPARDVACPCGTEIQTTWHVLLDCPLHHEARAHLRKVSNPPRLPRIFGSKAGLEALYSFIRDSNTFAIT